MEATPCEHELVADATKETEPETVEPFAGLVTVTELEAAEAQMADKRHTMSSRLFCMKQISK
jgi:hypothetical protein